MSMQYEVYGTITIPVCMKVKAKSDVHAMDTAYHLVNDYNMTLKKFDVEANGNTYALVTTDGGVVNWIVAYNEDDF